MLAFLLAAADTFGVEPTVRNPDAIFRVDDYPAAAKRRDAPVRIALTMLVGPDGRAVGCEVAVSTGLPGEDDRICALVRRRARFTPARDEAGAPIAGERNLVGTWWDQEAGRPVWPPLEPHVTLTVASLPDGEREARATVVRVIAPDGHVERCAVASSSGVPALDRAACGLLATHLPPRPIRDAAGASLRSRRAVRVAFAIE